MAGCFLHVLSPAFATSRPRIPQTVGFPGCSVARSAPVPGSVFCQLLMADEINRASPRTLFRLVRRISAIGMDIHVRTAAGRVGAKADAQSTIAEVSCGITHQGERRCNTPSHRYVGRQSGKPSRSLSINPRCEILGSDPPHCCRITTMEIVHRGPDASRCATGIDEIGVRTRAIGEKIGAGPPIQDILSRGDLQRVVAGAAMQKHIRGCREDVEIV
jgi:hypothetical protein